MGPRVEFLGFEVEGVGVGESEVRRYVVLTWGLFFGRHSSAPPKPRRFD